MRNLLNCIGMASRKSALAQTAIVRVPAKWQACQFPGAQKALVVGQELLEEVCLRLVPPLRRTARNPELMHSQLEGGPLYSEPCRCPVGTGHNPIALFKSFENLLTFRFLQNVVKGPICRFRRSGLFHRGAGVGKFKIANIDAKGRTRRDDYGALNHILKFSYVPRPMISAEGVHVRRRNRIHGLFHTS